MLSLIKQRQYRPRALNYYAGFLLSFLFISLLTAQVIQAYSQTPAEVVEVFSNEVKDCYILTTTPSGANQAATHTIVVSLPYLGTLEEASLLLISTNVRANTEHKIVVNGQDTGHYPPADTYSICGVSGPALIREYPLSPAILRPGANDITLTAEGTTDAWGVNYVALRVRGTDLKYGTFRAIKFPGSDGQLVDAVILEPGVISGPRPLLILFHGWNGKPVEPFLTDYTLAAVERGWLVVSPQQRGNSAGGQALASLRAQRDAVKLLQIMPNLYQVDLDRIYAGGFSMGGMMAGSLAAKYPDLFAAVVTHKAITDLRDWYHEQGAFRQMQIAAETYGTPSEVPFEYRRRSPEELARNLQNLPVAIVHGDADTTVLPHHATDFYNAVSAYQPRRVELAWYAGNHGDEPGAYGGEWAIQFMESYTRLHNPSSLHLVTDESKAFYWLDIVSSRTDPEWLDFIEIEAEVDHTLQTVTMTAMDPWLPIQLSFDLDRMGFDTQRSYVISQTNAATGTQLTAVLPIAGHLNWTVPQGQTMLQIRPNLGELPVTLRLRDGFEQYTGTSDTYLSAWEADTAYGSSPNIALRNGDVMKGLIRFDLENLLPSQIELQAANLKLYDEGSGPDMTISLHRLLRDWDETTATFNVARVGEPWSVPGGSHGVDWVAQAAASLALNSSDGSGYRMVSILDVVRTWLAEPESNQGLALRVQTSSASGARLLVSSDHWNSDLRPELELVFQPMEATATATPTPTATMTLTPSPTPTMTPTPTPVVGMLEGFVFDDLNGDFVYQPESEPALSGATIELWYDGTRIDQVLTGSDGAYSFDELEAGPYRLLEQAPEGYQPALPTNDIMLAVQAGRATRYDFAHQPAPSPTPTVTSSPTPHTTYIPMMLRG